MYIDTHAHLFYPNFNGELDQIIERAQNSGVDAILVPGTDIQTSIQAIELSKQYERLYTAVGVHPHETKEWNDELINQIETLTKNKKVVAIGEIGLDYYYDFSPREVQLKAFRAQIELALKLDLPVIVHNRDSNDDIMEIIREYADTSLRAQFHCFAGSEKDAKELIGMNHFISFPGNVTFKKADNIRRILKSIPPENLLLETDSPFMTPVPYRGKRNEPSYIPIIAETISEIHDISLDELAKITSYNTYKLFGIGKNPDLIFTYQIGDSLYINVTNRCNADCVFCKRKTTAEVDGYILKMKKTEEPDATVYINEIANPKKYKEIVFCGYGEPTIRWDVVKEVAKYVKDNGGKTRLNTNGHGNVINQRDITPEFEGLIDKVSVSLNSVYPEQYAELMRVRPEMHSEMLDFVKKAKQFTNVVMSIVGIDEVDKEKAKKLVTEEIGVEFRERAYF
ncbi:putative deoxyribonuclease ycfh [hydrocarbon metagenome]|uniref:Putative deoxyribonuclease ycfh n=1 Tax=hydrocarbon metagenome TaxID=938273 RepID=A0A0W8G134_9ZZZZ